MDIKFRQAGNCEKEIKVLEDEERKRESLTFDPRPRKDKKKNESVTHT